MKTCVLCDSEELEIIGSEVLCKTCGYGHGENATKKGLETHLQNIAKLVLAIKQLEPELTNSQITDRLVKVLHKVEKHPTRKDNFCEYCGE